MDVQPLSADVSLLPRLLLNLQQHPLETAVIFQGRCITNCQLLAKIRKLAQHLHSAGLTRGAVVAVYVERSPDLLVILLALWLCEAVYLPLDSSWPPARLQECCGRANPLCVLVQADLQEQCKTLALPMLVLQPMDFAAAVEQDPTSPKTSMLPAPAPDALAYILFTSGSTGSPKGVPVTHGNLATLFAGVMPLLDLQTSWRVLGCASHCFDIMFFELLAPLLSGGILVLADKNEYRDPGQLLGLLSTHRINVVQATPSLWSLMLQTGLSAVPRIELALSTGEALPVGCARQLLTCTHNLWNLYGPTECTVWASACRITPAMVETTAATLPIGAPLPGYHFALQPVEGDHEADNTGELLISGNGVTAGYLNDPQASARSFIRTAGNVVTYHSGDYCSRDAADCYRFIRRLDNQVKVNGYRIETEEVALRLEQHSSIRQALCLARTRTDGVDQLLAFVVCEPNMPNKDKTRWNRHLSAWLPPWMLPDRYFLLDALPLTSTGKVDRLALLALADNTANTQPAGNDSMQAEVSRIFCSVLELDSIGPCDSFFDVGGSSMLSATLVLAVNQRFNTNLGLRAALQVPPTVTSMCKLLEAAGARMLPG